MWIVAGKHVLRRSAASATPGGRVAFRSRPESGQRWSTSDDRLGDRFGLLTGGSRAALPRHQALRTASFVEPASGVVPRRRQPAHRDRPERQRHVASFLSILRAQDILRTTSVRARVVT